MSNYSVEKQQTVKRFIQECEVQISEYLEIPVKIDFKLRLSHLTVADIKEEVLTVLNVSWEAIVKQNRKRPLAMARHIFFWLVDQYTLLNQREIGELMNRDRTTMLHSIQVVNDAIDIKFEEVTTPLNTIIANLKNKKIETV